MSWTNLNPFEKVRFIFYIILFFSIIIIGLLAITRVPIDGGLFNIQCNRTDGTYLMKIINGYC